MDSNRYTTLKRLIPLVFIVAAGCSPTSGSAGANMTGTAAGRGTAPFVPTWTSLPTETATATPTFTPTFTSTPSFYATAISAGRRHTCVIADGGRIKCWGENEDGQLGDGTTVLKRTAVDVTGMQDTIIKISSGYNHTCAITAGRDVLCWGNNAYGQLGDETQSSRTAPVEVRLPVAPIDISVGTNHTCATNGEDLYCWGIVDYLILDGLDVVYLVFEPIEMNVSNIPDNETIASLASGYTHDCLLTNLGNVYCWGWNALQQLGQAEAFYSINAPMKVGGLDGRARQLTVGAYHSCALLSEGTVSCWGYNKYGQSTGVPSDGSGQPLQVSGIQGATAIAAGAYHTCAVMGSGGVKCWGDQRFGQLGGAAASGNPIVEVAGVTGVRSLSAGASHTCALLEGGGITCWGNNKFGQLGDNSFTAAPTPTLAATESTRPAGSTETPALDLSRRAKSIASGRNHTCAVTESGGVRCWGKNEHGELGNGTFTDSGIPVSIVSLSSGVKSVVVGWGHTCALTESGGVKCWGYNKNGELGNGGNDTSNVPVNVRGLESGVTSLEAADDHTCAILSDGSVRCWGFNLYGQLGDGTAVDSNLPVKVAGLTDGVTSIAAGWGHTCALSSTGAVRCWGNNHYGQVGNGSEKENYHVPVTVSGLSKSVTAISADGGHTCALTSEGLLMCWGNNKYGQLGDGTAEVRRSPVVVVGLNRRPVKIVAGWNHTCIVDGSGNMSCWGWNYYGQLGNGMRTTSTKPVDSGQMMYGVAELALGWGNTCVVTDRGGVQCWGLNEFGQLGDGTTTNSYLPVDVIGLIQ